MANELITVQVGQAGIRIGDLFWRLACSEHGIRWDGLPADGTEWKEFNANSIFRGCTQAKRTPRGIFVDLEPTTIQHVASFARYFYDTDFCIAGNSRGGNNFAKGYLTEGPPLLNSFSEKLRFDAEMCDNLEGIQFIHAAAGGSGAGLGSLLLENIRDNYPKSLLLTMTVFPSFTSVTSMLEPYNTTFALSKLASSKYRGTSASVLFDNVQMLDICCKKSLSLNPILEDVNYLIALAISGINCCNRFPGQPTMRLKNLTMSMVPYSSLSLLVPSFAPLFGCRTGALMGIHSNTSSSSKLLVKEMLDPASMMVNLSPSTIESTKNRLIAATGIFRGNVDITEAQKQLNMCIEYRNAQLPSTNITVDDSKQNFSRFSSHSIHCCMPPPCFDQSSILLGNYTGISYNIRKIVDVQKRLMSKKAFLHWFIAEGIDEDTINEAIECCVVLADDYGNAGEDINDITNEDE